MSDDKTETSVEERTAERCKKAGGIASPADASQKQRPTMRIVEFKFYEIDFDKVLHWTDVKKIMRAQRCQLAIDFDDPDCQYTGIRHLLKEVEK